MDLGYINCKFKRDGIRCPINILWDKPIFRYRF